MPDDQEAAASLAQIENAIHSLTDEQVKRLYAVAYTLKGKLMTLTPEDLVTVALERTLDGPRNWYCERVDFVQHLIGVMCSMASHNPRSRGAKLLDADNLELAAPIGNPEFVLMALDDDEQARRYVEAVEDFFSDDDDVTLLLEEIKEGRTGQAACESLGLSKKEYATLRKRYRRGINQLQRQGKLA